MVVIDALSGLILGQSMAKDEVATQIADTLDIWLPGLAVVLIHHDKKTRYGQDGTPLEPSNEDFLGSQMWRANSVSQIHMWRLNEHQSVLRHEKSQVSALHPEDLRLYIDLHGAVELWDQKRADDVIDKLHNGIFKLGIEDLPAMKQIQALSEYYNVGQSTISRWKALAKRKEKQ